ncbi:DUF4913 domain-containing protein (plasmid) [Nocardiopsis flavescens]|uniref:DUF4913 domain-containing protein n=1 Tax=Nocardiopsis flavescens TaxID=758803 RepID=A0A6M5KB80_9ACTN|nr:DUF4913 domain-containing protein [Nocardiopsis flavescens]QKW32440.1 DUF4913 domain-containing protein [Nocardiopsis flavescens]
MTGANSPEPDQFPDIDLTLDPPPAPSTGPRADLQHLDSPHFPDSAAAEQTEIDKLRSWVSDYLVPVWVHSVSAEQPWCTSWQEHDDALSSLHALYRAWQGLINTEGDAGLVGPSNWIVHHLGPIMARLRDPRGPFRRCVRGTTKIEHHLPEPAPTA